MLPPLAERMRPSSLDQYVGQRHLVGKGCILRNMIESGNLSSFILWGPPGVGKTTLARIIANSLSRDFYTLSAISSGVKDVRDVIDKAKSSSVFSNGTSPVLFIDEIHRFNKGQQDALLGAVENGTIVLIGATTENPSFEVITPLLSRCQVFVLKSLEVADLQQILERAVKTDVLLKEKNIKVNETDALFRYSGGDGRKLLNILEIVIDSQSGNKQIVVDNKAVTASIQENSAIYDKDGEMHYDIISAFIKSASEDVGLANPNALLLANACFQVVHEIGMPEARIPLAETTVYLASSPKSNTAYMALEKALGLVRQDHSGSVPLYLRNAPTKLMSELGYADGYKYAHDYPGHFVDLEFMPKGLEGTVFYEPAQNQHEDRLKAYLEACWPKYYKPE